MAQRWLDKDKGLTAEAMRRDRGIEAPTVEGTVVGASYPGVESEASVKSKKRSSSFNPYYMAKEKDPEREPPSCCSINCSIL